MKNKKAVMISLAIAGVAVLFVSLYINERERALLEMATPITVVFSARDIPEGARMDVSMLETREIPKTYIQPGAVGEIPGILDKEVIVPILRDTQITGAMFAASVGGSLSDKVPEGMRAFSVAVSEVTAVAELIQPGDFVDLLVTVEIGSYQEGQGVREGVLTRTVLENVMVLAANRMSSKPEYFKADRVAQKAEGSLFSKDARPREKRESLRTLTLALTPEDVQRVCLAQEIGGISASLRSRWEDGKPRELPALDTYALLGVKKVVVPKASPAWIEIKGSESYDGYR